MIAKETDISGLREAGRRLGEVLNEVSRAVAPGVSVFDLNEKTEQLIREKGDTPAFLNYRPEGVSKPFPATLCVAINDVVVHGIPTERNTVLQEGDIIGLDTGLIHKGYIMDSGITVPVGKVTKDARMLIEVTREALSVGIAEARLGNTVGDIGYAIEQFVKPHGYGIVRELCGHGVGKKVHEEPSIPNYGRRGEGAALVSGMILAIEPMLNIGGAEVLFDENEYTARTRDGSLSAHFEHTIMVTEDGPEILTKAPFAQ